MLRLELAEKYFEEARELLARGDSVQSSEKLYKAAEERIKVMGKAMKLKEAEEARAKGRWTLKLLDSAALELSKRVESRIYDDWDHAYFLHVEGFHESRLGVEQVEGRMRYIEKLLSIARRALGKELPPRRKAS